MATGYCVKCRKAHEIQNGQEVKMKSGARAMKGTCGTHGTGMFAIMKKDAT